MRRRGRRSCRWMAALVAVIGMCSMPFVAGAVPTDLTWTGRGNQEWADFGGNWVSGSSDASIPFVDGDNVTFPQPQGEAFVNLRPAGIVTGSMTVERGAGYIFGGGPLQISGGLVLEEEAVVFFENDRVLIGGGQGVSLGRGAVLSIPEERAVYCYSPVSFGEGVTSVGEGAWIDCLPKGGFLPGESYHRGVAFAVRDQSGQRIPAQYNPRVIVLDADEVLWQGHRDKAYDPDAGQQDRWYAVRGERMTIRVSAEGYADKTMTLQVGPGVTFDIGLEPDEFQNSLVREI